MKQKLPTKLASFFLYFVAPYKWSIMALVVAEFICGAGCSLISYPLKTIIDTVVSHVGDKSSIFQVVTWPIVTYISIWFLMAISYRVRDFIHLKIFPTIRANMINSMFDYLSHHSYSYLQNNFAGKLSTKILDMASSAISAFRMISMSFLHSIFAFLTGLVIMLYISPIFALILVVWAVFFIGIALFCNKRTQVLSEIFSESKSTLSGKVVDSVTNLINILLFARINYERQIIKDTVDDTISKDKAVQLYIMKIRAFWDVTFIVLVGSMFYSLVFLYSRDLITVGDFALIIVLTVTIIEQLWELADHLVQFAEEIGVCSQALTIINAPHEIVDIPGAKLLKVTKGNIVFDNVTFHYKNGTALFNNKYVEIKAKTKVGLVGFSGSGKTTFINLILRLFEVEKGHILIDKQDVSKVTQDSLHENIAMIPQDVSLFHRTLMENIRYGKLDATNEEIIEASKRAHCHEFVKQLPQGYDTLVGERGIKLSGGQRQRIAVARAILKNAPILILDEATSALDSITEKYIQDSLHRLMESRTTIVIAHRLSTLSAMDRILVFDKGKIIEDGTHETLLKNGKHYAKMWNMQAGGFLPDKDGEEF